MAKTCTADNCSYPVWGKGFCRNHQYMRTDNKKPKKPKFRSAKEQDRLNNYYPIREEYLQTYPNCEFPECGNYSTDIHHMMGREGDLLFNTKYFAALCRMHHRYVEDHPKEALELGLRFERLIKR